MCQCNPVIRLTEEGNRLKLILKIMFFIYIFFVVAKIFLFDLQGALSDLINVLILILSFLVCHYMLVSLLLFMVFFSCFNNLVFLGLRIQNKIKNLPDTYISKGIYTHVVIVQSLEFIFYIFLIYYAFQTYKEFKAIYLSNDGYSNIQIT